MMNPFLESKKGRPLGSSPMVVNRTEKKCSGCKEVKTLDQFYLDSVRADGRDSYCIPCKKEIHRVHRLKKLGKPVTKKDQKLIEEVRQMPCVISGANGPNDPHHILSKGAGGPDEPWNLAPLKHSLHQEFHRIGFVSFAAKYPKFRDWLHENNWNFCEVSKKWRHYK